MVHRKRRRRTSSHRGGVSVDSSQRYGSDARVGGSGENSASGSDAQSKSASPHETQPAAALPTAGTDIVDDGSATRALSGGSTLNLPLRRIDRLHNSDADYRMVDRLGVGGMATVDLALQRGMQRLVALKRLIPARAEEPEIAERFLREALVMGLLEHPGVVPVYEVAQDQLGRPFYTMKMVRGCSWRETIAQGDELGDLRVLERVAEAVGHAHQHGILHRDLKPDNVMLGDYGEVYLIDWGLAGSIVRGSLAQPITLANVMSGTVGYLAPEVANGELHRVGVESDIYMLGGLLFCLATGLSPHGHLAGEDRLASARANRLSPSDRDDLLMAVARRAMADDPMDRHRSIASFLVDLERCRQAILAVADRPTGEHGGC